MYANSWLYHYYTAQSKIQFGIPYDGPARIQATANDTYLNQQQPQEQQQQQNQDQTELQNHNNQSHHHHHHHHSFHHYSPNSLQTPLTHSYLAHSPHGVASYGYHSPVAQHHQNHYGNSTPHLSYHHSSNDGYRPYAYRIDAILPVDYSGNISPMANASNNGNIKSSNSQADSESGSPPAKRRIVNRLEPLFIPEHPNESSSDEILHAEQIYQTTTGDGGTVLLTTVIPGRYAHTHIKAIANEPAELMDQWNISPPWSVETTQKVPDIAQQELCYLSRTPPTPTSAPLNTVNGVAFSFDWMPEQFVPIADTMHHNNNNNNHLVPNGPTLSHSALSAGEAAAESTTLMSTVPLSTSPNEHKFYNMDRSPENAIIRGMLFIDRFAFVFLVFHINAKKFGTQTAIFNYS